ncbi:glycosyltransferase [Reyranella soli]|uniref:D-inositol 3-phosphate glycosyltransferase n=1 Tax=Reyranella soli TaxID=1230389 RepID=A0A512NR68_9HYPH|nr:glycosyltransferase [Reyranella soli]GEP61435.1 hypothetical protein RSO01_86010 [Reyranella soli]
MTTSEHELLRLLRLDMEYNAENLDTVSSVAGRFVAGELDGLGPKDTAFLVEALFKFGRVSLAHSVVNARVRLEHPTTAFDTFADQYHRLQTYDFLALPRRVRRITSSGRRRPRILSFLSSALPFQSTGYTLRTQALLTNTALDVAPYGRIGYPWTAGLLKNAATEHMAASAEVQYKFRRGGIRSQTDIFTNMGLAKREIEKVLHLENPDVVHAASNFATAFPALLAARAFGLPFVYEMRGFWELTAGVGVHGWIESERYLLERRMERILARSADVVISLSETQKKELTTWDVAAAKIRVVANCCDEHTPTDSHAPSDRTEQLRREIRGRRVLGYIGSLVRYEGLQDLLSVLGDPRHQLDDIVLLIAGDGPYAAELRGFADRMNLSSRVIFVGKVPKEDVDSIYRLMDICVLPRIPEPVCELITPLKPIECLAQGRVLLVSDVAAMAEQVKAFGFGETFRAGDLLDLGRKLRDILSDLPGMQRRYATAAEALKAKFSWSNGTRAWDEAIQAAVTSTPASADIARTTTELYSSGPAVQRDRSAQLRRIGRLTIETTPGKRFLLRCPGVEVRHLRILSIPAGTDLATNVSLSRPADITDADLVELNISDSGDQTLFVYLDRSRARDLALKDFAVIALHHGSGLDSQSFVRMKAETRDIVAIELTHRPDKATKIEIETDYDQAMQFAATIVPFDGAQLTPTFGRFSVSNTVGARFHYITVPPERTIVTVLPRIVGRFMFELSPWTGEHQTRPSQIRKLHTIDEVEREGSYFVNLDPTKMNILVAADLNENLVDGSAVWLKTLVSALSAHQHVNVYVVTNAIQIPNSNTAELFSRANVVKVDLDTHGSGQGERLGEEILKLDRVSGGFDFLVVRGFTLAKALDTKYLRDRLVLYTVGLISPDNVENGKLASSPLLNRARRTAGLIFQNETTRSIFKASAPDYQGDLYIVPPSVDPLVLNAAAELDCDAGSNELVVYSGKLVREYGILELLDAAIRVAAERPNFRLVLLGNKFDGRDITFQTEFLKLVTALGQRVEWHSAVSQSEVLAWVKLARAVWGWRYGEFETGHFETSTKMIEAIVCGAPIVLFPSDANVELLGSDYRGFARTPEQAVNVLVHLLEHGDPAFERRHQPLAKSFSSNEVYGPLIHGLTKTWRDRCLPRVTSPASERLVVSSHDFRFFEDIEGLFLKNGVLVQRDFWRTHTVRHAYGQPEPATNVVFCDWCLGNAVWWSRNIPESGRLVIRLHLQEMFTDHPTRVDFSRVHRVIFVSPEIMRQAQAKFKIPAEICTVVPISVGLKPCTSLKVETDQRRNLLGMVGVTPWRKRMDKAIDLLLALRRSRPTLRLLVKGSMPSEYDWMATRREELRDFQELFRQVSELERNGIIEFSGYDAEMEDFYARVGWILSVSDFEGCHTAVAEGGVMGCLPLMTEWGGAKEVYSPELVQSGLSEMVDYFERNYARFDSASTDLQKVFIRRFSTNEVFLHWNKILFGKERSATVQDVNAIAAVGVS